MRREAGEAPPTTEAPSPKSTETVAKPAEKKPAEEKSAEKKPADAPPIDPEADRLRLQLPPGFEVNLFAADPAVAKPIQMNFDNRGRLWVVSSETYPQLEPGAEPRDKVFILEDADRDGKSEKSILYADGLHIPTGIEIGDGGVYVGQSTELLHLSDTDGDGRADRRRVVLSGFGTEDTHHLIHTFRWAPGGQLFFAQSVYIHSHVETPWGVQRLNAGGFWTLRTNKLLLDVFVRGMVNTWGIAFDDFGQSFGVDNDNTSIKYFLPGSSMAHTPGERHILDGLVHNKPKYCGADFVATKHFPDDWQGNYVTCDFRAHRVARYKFTDAGAGFAAEELEPLVVSDNVAFRPIDVKFGPDGALYVCDWYNPIINHGEVDFRDSRRDKTQGRIWRITAKGRPAAARPKIADAPIADLLELQKSPEGPVRHFARRTLTERPRAEVLTALAEWAPRQIEEPAALAALWSYQTVDAPNEAALRKVLAAKD
ncbi:MAG: PVC-type heme-binding CxxCH protein, partial [Planctomycetia bacterium]